MTTIPDDIMKAAREALAKAEEIMPWIADPDGVKADIIARAILAERERCARVAYARRDEWMAQAGARQTPYATYMAARSDAAEDIAAAIRKGEA